MNGARLGLSNSPPYPSRRIVWIASEMFSLACLRVLLSAPRLIPPRFRIIRAISFRVSLLFAISCPSWSIKSVSNWARVRVLRVSSLDTIGSFRISLMDFRVPSCQVSVWAKGPDGYCFVSASNCFRRSMQMRFLLRTFALVPVVLLSMRQSSGYTSLIRGRWSTRFWGRADRYGRSDRSRL